MRGLRRRMLGRIARRAISRGHRTRYLRMKSLITSITIIDVNVSQTFEMV